VIKITVDGAAQFRRKLSSLSGLTGQLAPTMRAATIMLERDIKLKGLTGKKGWDPFFGVTGASGDALGSRSGDTRRSVTSEVVVAPSRLVGVVGSPSKSLRFHEHGGSIKGNPWLAIPLAAVQTKAGVARATPRMFPMAFWFTSKAGRLFLAMRGRGGELIPLFLMKHKVRIRARHVFEAALKRTKSKIDKLFDDAVKLRVSR